MILDGTIELPDDFEWINEFDWVPVERQQQYAADGALHITDSLKQAGRPLHFRGEENTCWITRTEMVALSALAEQPDKIMTLELSDSRTFSVMFDHAAGAIDATKLLKNSYFDDDDYYQINAINFIEV